jgi:tetratricopeptide (TPR) repeat protein
VYYKKIIEKDTTNFMVYKQLANISYDQSDPANQLIYLKKANQLNPAEPDVASDLGDLYVALKQFSLAKNILDDAISQDPENAVLLLSELKLAYSQNDWADTKAAAMALTQTGNHSGFVLTRLGVAYYYLKDYECCLETLSEMSPMEQTETSCYFTAMAYKGINDQPNAIVYMTKAIDEGISANICNYYSEMADSYETLKKFKKSIIAYQKGLQFEEKPLIYYLMATLYDSDLKNKKVALGYYKKYLAANPPAKEEKYIVFAKSRIGLLKR